MSAMVKIGDLASKSGLSRDTIRFYEREALLPEPHRTRAGYRLYSPEILDRLSFIKQAQALGFSLTEIREVLDGYHDVTECHHVAALLRQKITEMDQHLRDIQALRTILSSHLMACEHALENGSAHAGCPVLGDIARQAGRLSEETTDAEP